MLLDIPSTHSENFLKLLEKRGLKTSADIHAFLHAGLESLRDPMTMKGMPEAVSLTREYAKKGKSVLVHGDYDVDGVTGAALVGRTLAALGIKHKIFLPDRVEDGYGVSESAIVSGHKEGFGLLITVDCGVTAGKKIEKARSLGMDVIIIDHHTVPEDGVPNANAVLNPRQKGCDYAFKELSAAGLAYKFSQALLGEKANDFLDLAALSTVCDVAPLESENRIIVRKGLEILSERKNPGIKAMIESAGVKTRALNVGHLGFTLGPRINAAGRMSSPQIALQVLMTENVREAVSLAGILEQENKSRQAEEKQMIKEAIEETGRVMNFNRDRVIVVGRDGWHQGVIGIVASRLVDKYHRPAVVIALADGKGKGSGRSIKGFHLFNALDACKDLFIEFGGHEQAAGLSITKDNLNAFRAKINQHAAENYKPEDFVRKINSDLTVSFKDLHTGFLEELKLLEPHGMGNARPVFSTKGVIVKTSAEKMWENLKFWFADQGLIYEGIISGRMADEYLWIQKGMTLDIAYSVKTRVWNGAETVQLEIKDAKLVS